MWVQVDVRRARLVCMCAARAEASSSTHWRVLANMMRSRRRPLLRSRLANWRAAFQVCSRLSRNRGTYSGQTHQYSIDGRAGSIECVSYGLKLGSMVGACPGAGGPCIAD